MKQRLIALGLCLFLYFPVQAEKKISINLSKGRQINWGEGLHLKLTSSFDSSFEFDVVVVNGKTEIFVDDFSDDIILDLKSMWNENQEIKLRRTILLDENMEHVSIGMRVNKKYDYRENTLSNPPKIDSSYTFLIEMITKSANEGKVQLIRSCEPIRNGDTLKVYYEAINLADEKLWGFPQYGKIQGILNSRIIGPNYENRYSESQFFAWNCWPSVIHDFFPGKKVTLQEAIAIFPELPSDISLQFRYELIYRLDLHHLRETINVSKNLKIRLIHIRTAWVSDEFVWN